MLNRTIALILVLEPLFVITIKPSITPFVQIIPPVSLMLLYQRANSTTLTAPLPGNSSSPNPRASPEVVVAIVFGVIMLLLALIGLWQNHQGRKCADPPSDPTTLHARWIGFTRRHRLDVSDVDTGYAWLPSIATRSMTVCCALVLLASII